MRQEKLDALQKALSNLLDMVQAASKLLFNNPSITENEITITLNNTLNVLKHINYSIEQAQQIAPNKLSPITLDQAIDNSQTTIEKKIISTFWNANFNDIATLYFLLNHLYKNNANDIASQTLIARLNQVYSCAVVALSGKDAGLDIEKTLAETNKDNPQQWSACFKTVFENNKILMKRFENKGNNEIASTIRDLSASDTESFSLESEPITDQNKNIIISYIFYNAARALDYQGFFWGGLFDRKSTRESYATNPGKQQALINKLSAKGYQDFAEQLKNLQNGPSNTTPKDIINTLNDCLSCCSLFYTPFKAKLLRRLQHANKQLIAQGVIEKDESAAALRQG